LWSSSSEAQRQLAEHASLHFPQDRAYERMIKFIFWRR